MSNDLIFLKAEPTDAVEAVQLIGLADPEAIIDISGKATYADALKEYEKNFSRTDVYFSFKNTIVAKINNQLVGCILFFKGEDEVNYFFGSEREDSSIRESEDDEIYIDSLAVDERYRGKGIAKQLIKYVVQESVSLGYKKISLLADVSQPHLGKMYSDLGFKVKSKMILLDTEYDKFVFEH